MFAILPVNVDRNVGRNDALRQYARWEYGSPETAWLLAAATPRRRTATLAARIRRFVRSGGVPAVSPDGCAHARL